MTDNDFDINPVTIGQFSLICYMLGVPENQISDLYKLYLANISGDEEKILKEINAFNVRSRYRMMGRDN